MPTITAIHGGGDWADASANYLILPEGMDIEVESEAWRKWYDEEYCPALRAANVARDLGSDVVYPEFAGLFDWCIARGARTPTDDELHIFEEADDAAKA